MNLATSTQDRETIWHLWSAEGRTINEIAELVGRHDITIRNYVTRHPDFRSVNELKPHREKLKSDPPSSDLANNIYRLYRDELLGHQVIADRLKTKQSYVVHVLGQHPDYPLWKSQADRTQLAKDRRLPVNPQATLCRAAGISLQLLRSRIERGWPEARLYDPAKFQRPRTRVTSRKGRASDGQQRNQNLAASPALGRGS